MKIFELLLHFLVCVRSIANFLKPYGGGFARVFSPHSVLCHAAE